MCVCVCVCVGGGESGRTGKHKSLRRGGRLVAGGVDR